LWRFAAFTSSFFSASVTTNITVHKRSSYTLSPIPSVGLSVQKVYCGKTADWIRMPFGVVSVVGRGMGVLDGGGDRRRESGSFGDEFRASYCNQCGRRRSLPKLLWGRLVFTVLVFRDKSRHQGHLLTDALYRLLADVVFHRQTDRQTDGRRTLRAGRSVPTR